MAGRFSDEAILDAVAHQTPRVRADMMIEQPDDYFRVALEYRSNQILEERRPQSFRKLAASLGSFVSRLF